MRESLVMERAPRRECGGRSRLLTMKPLHSSNGHIIGHDAYKAHSHALYIKISDSCEITTTCMLILRTMMYLYHETRYDLSARSSDIIKL